MELQQKQTIVSIIGAIGLIILLSGIFLPNVSFTHALFIAISLWILSGVVATFLGISNRTRVQQYSGWKSGIVSLIGSFGVIILLSGIFLNVPFNTALFVAIIFWIGSGVVAAFLGVNRRSYYYRQSSVQYQPSGSQQYQPVSNQYDQPISQYPPVQASMQSQQPYSTTTQPSINPNVDYEGPAKKFCPKCGASTDLDAAFCFNCGTNLH